MHKYVANYRAIRELCEATCRRDSRNQADQSNLEIYYSTV